MSSVIDLIPVWWILDQSSGAWAGECRFGWIWRAAGQLVHGHPVPYTPFSLPCTAHTKHRSWIQRCYQTKGLKGIRWVNTWSVVRDLTSSAVRKSDLSFVDDIQNNWRQNNLIKTKFRLAYRIRGHCGKVFFFRTWHCSGRHNFLSGSGQSRGGLNLPGIYISKKSRPKFCLIQILSWLKPEVANTGLSFFSQNNMITASTILGVRSPNFTGI